MKYAIGTIYVDIDSSGLTRLFVEYGQEGGCQIGGPARLKEELESQYTGWSIVTTLQHFFSQKCRMSISKTKGK